MAGRVRPPDTAIALTAQQERSYKRFGREASGGLAVQNRSGLEAGDGSREATGSFELRYELIEIFRFRAKGSNLALTVQSRASFRWTSPDRKFGYTGADVFGDGAMGLERREFVRRKPDL